MNTVAVFLIVLLAAVALGSNEYRQVSPKAAICGQMNDICGINRFCCKGYTCRNYGVGQRRCQLGTGGSTGCIRRGMACSTMNTLRRCCVGSVCRRGMYGQSKCM